MKTKIYNLIVIAALSIISITATAQNTKSYYVTLKSDNKLLASAERKNSFLTAKDDLYDQLSKITEYVKFTPKTSSMEYNETIESNFWTNVLKELEGTVKYTPNASLLMKYEQEQLAKEISNELIPLVKYNPAESKIIQQYEQKEQFSEILKELEAEVKFKPTVMP